jgi:hypothetical protein
MLRFPHNDATLTRLRAVQFDDPPTDNIVEVVFRQNYQIYYIQRCNDWICPLSQHLADGYYDWYVRMCDGNVCWRITEIWHFTLQREG